MPRRFFRQPRARERGFRILLATAAAGLGYLATVHALAAALPDGSAKIAHFLAPDDGRITARLARHLLHSQAEPTQYEPLARMALSQDPTAIDAITSLGLAAQIRGDKVVARRLFAYSERLSRRDLQTQLWMIEDSVGRGDIDGALKHYDIALRTSKGAPDLLFPILASAITDDPIRNALIKRLADHPAWGPDFVSYVAGRGEDPVVTAELFRGLQRVGVSVPQVAQASVLNALIANGAVREAWAYYATVRPGVDRRISRDPTFLANLDVPTVFDWVLANRSGISTSIQGNGPNGGAFVFSTPTSLGGTLLQQVQMLPAGEYIIEGRSEGINQPDTARPYWALRCGDKREIGRLILPNSDQNGGRFFGHFTVPAECEVQVLSFIARPSDAISGVSGQIDRIQLQPVPSA